MFYSSHTIVFPLLPCLWHLSFPHWPNSLTHLCCLFWYMLKHSHQMSWNKSYPQPLQLLSSRHPDISLSAEVSELCLATKASSLKCVCTVTAASETTFQYFFGCSPLFDQFLFSFTSYKWQPLTQLSWEKPFRSCFSLPQTKHTFPLFPWISAPVLTAHPTTEPCVSCFQLHPQQEHPLQVFIKGCCL